MVMNTRSNISNSLAHSRGIAGCEYMTNAWILCSLQIVLYIDTYQLVDIYGFDVAVAGSFVHCFIFSVRLQMKILIKNFAWTGHIHPWIHLATVKKSLS